MRTGHPDFRWLLAASAWLGLLGCHAAPPAASAVWWTSAVGLDSPASIPKAIEQPWQAPVAAAKDGASASITNCASSLDLQAKGYTAIAERDGQALQSLTVRCLALRAIQQAKPASQSALAKFELTPAVVNLLPPGLSLIVSNDDQRRVQAAVEKGQTWKDLEPTLRASSPSPGVIELNTDSTASTLRVLAGGADFDGDGWEDLLIEVSHALKGGSYRSVRLALVTRKSTQGPLVFVKDLVP